MIVTVPDLAPCDVGEKVTLIVQVAPGIRFARQVEVMPNSWDAFMDESFNSALPPFVSLTVCGALVEPTACFLKFRGVIGEKTTTPVLRMVFTAFPK